MNSESLDAFVEQLWRDVEFGVHGTLDAYLKIFQGADRAIEEEYRACLKDLPPPTPSELVKAQQRELLKSLPHLGPYPRIGSRLIGPNLGNGAMGSVFQAWHIGLERPEAVKLVLGKENKPLYNRAFIEECKKSARTGHRNVIAVQDAGYAAEGTPFLVMELVAGEDLSSFIKRMRVIDEETAVWILHQIAQGLSALHSVGTIHRDIKPANIMVARDRTVKIGDLGVAYDSNLPPLRSTGTYVGTPAYMAPEVRLGMSRGPACDVFSLGATFAHLLLGSWPIESLIESLSNGGASYERLLMDTCQQRRPDLSPGTVDLLLRMCKFDHTKRIQNMAPILDYLNERVQISPPAGFLVKAPSKSWAVTHPHLTILMEEEIRRSGEPPAPIQMPDSPPSTVPVLPLSTPPKRIRAIRPAIIALSLIVVGTAIGFDRFRSELSPMPQDSARSEDDASPAQARRTDEPEDMKDITPNVITGDFRAPTSSEAAEIFASIDADEVGSISAVANRGILVFIDCPLSGSTLHRAVFRGSRRVLKWMLEQPACRPDRQRQADGRRPLDLAAFRGDALAVQILIEAGARFDLPGHAGRLPLHEAAFAGNVGALALLAAKAVDLNAANSADGKTALYYAVESGNVETVQALIKAGADPERISNSGLTPRQAALQSAWQGIRKIFEK